MLENWNIRRLMYFAGGILFLIIVVKDRAWWMAIFGVYFLAMAIFRFGCAAANCTYEPRKDDQISEREKI